MASQLHMARDHLLQVNSISTEAHHRKADHQEGHQEAILLILKTKDRVNTRRQANTSNLEGRNTRLRTSMADLRVVNTRRHSQEATIKHQAHQLPMTRSHGALVLAMGHKVHNHPREDMCLILPHRDITRADRTGAVFEGLELKI
jgi:hypothetical protein